jgi:hypothetical protein
MFKNKKIIVAALNWGLGHATRCVPIIEALPRVGVQPILASDGQAGELLRDNFTHLEYRELPSYDISYPYKSMFLNMAVQLPKIYKIMGLERRMLADIVQQEQINAIISDNRFGLYHHNVFSVFMTHQLNPIIPNFFLEKMAYGYYHRLIARFSRCWVVDTQHSDLAGRLSCLPKRFKGEYIGALSRFDTQVFSQPIVYDAVFLLSGVEPQRTIFEKLCLAQAALFPNKRFILIRGLPIETQNLTLLSTNVEIRSFCPAEDLPIILSQSALLVARAGYSTIMDLHQMALKNVVLVPTPAQTEQEFLAKELLKKKICYTCAQLDFSLEKAWSQVSDFIGFQPIEDKNLLSKAISNLLIEL